MLRFNLTRQNSSSCKRNSPSYKHATAYLVALQQLQEGALVSLEGPPAYDFEAAVDPVTLSDLVDPDSETEQANPRTEDDRLNLLMGPAENGD